MSSPSALPRVPLSETVVAIAAPLAVRSRLELLANLLADAPPDPAPGARLLWRDPARRVQTLLVAPGAVLGRERACTLWCDDEKISRRHCRFTQDASGRWFVEDLESTNGTIVNGRRVPRAELCDGDVLTLGVTEMVFLRG